MQLECYAVTEFRTLIIPASLAAQANTVAAALSPAGAGMFTTGLSITGTEPATHYVSTGHLGADFAAIIVDGSLLHGACVDAGVSITLAECQALVTAADVSEEEPFVAFERLGVQLIQAEG